MNLRHCFFEIAALVVLVTSAGAQELENLIPKNQNPVMKVFPPSTVDQCRPGVGKFVISTRESGLKVSEHWDFTASPWECIPSRPETPITKRFECYHSSWNWTPLLNTLVADDSDGMHPRYVTFQIARGGRDSLHNLYDINYRTWESRSIWEGERLIPFGVMDDSIFCRPSDSWLLVDGVSGKGGEKEDVSTPIEMWATAGSGVPVSPIGIQLNFLGGTALEFRARKGAEGA